MLDPLKNFARVTVSIPYDNTATNILINAGQGVRLPNPSVDRALNLVTLGSVGGEETHTLTIAEMSSHTHTFGRNSGISGSYSPDVSAGFTPMNDLITSYATGGRSAHNNVQPFGVANYIAKT